MNAFASTYRLQFHAGFTFNDATRLVPYLHALGVSHMYASPYLRARSGSTHGYDVADPNSLNPELGSAEDFSALVAALQHHGMGQLVDVVPNHMGIGDPGNYRWRDVLENGPASMYARFFDINWRGGKIVVPTLGDQYGVVLENGELSVQWSEDDGAFIIAYYEHRFPVAPDSYLLLLEEVRERLEEDPRRGLAAAWEPQDLGRRHEHVQELASIITGVRHLPPRRPLDAAELEERNREKEIIKRRIRRLRTESNGFRDQLDVVLDDINGQRGDTHSFDRLDQLIEEQSYRLAFWRVAAEEINYRRFFDITELAAVRMEDPIVFQDTHRLLLRLIGEGKIQGLRIDHPDGLRDPAGYFRTLQESCAAATGKTDEPFYIVVEKILEVDEELRTDWPVAGTTGYEFLNAVNGLFVARQHERFFETIYFRFLRQGVQRFSDLANSTKKMVMLISLASEVNELALLLKDIANSDRKHRDFTLNSLAFAVREVIASLPIYRTYIDPVTGESSRPDRDAIQTAVADAKRRNPRTDPSIFDFIGQTLLSRDPGHLEFVARFQQTTGPVMAKGTEDTAFYVFNRLISLNEVGGEPDQFGRSITAFHRHNTHRARQWPAALLASSTHDTKRSEDVRARINVLSELPRDWRSALTRWSRLNGRKKSQVNGRVAPDRNEEYLLYQTLLGAWPFGCAMPDPEFVERVVGFMRKALKEAKVHTSWITPNDAYEESVLQFVRTVLDPSESAAFLEDLAPLRERVAFFGIFNSLSQTALKLGSPGVADVYQGQELWDFSLVDPDNRRPVDFEQRERELRSIAAAEDRLALARELVDTREDGRIKLYVTHCLMCMRREQPGLFVGAGYTPLRAGRHACAFARSADGATLVVAAPVQIATLTRGATTVPIAAEVWREDSLVVPAGRYCNVFTGQTLDAERGALPLAEVFSDFPVAALIAG
ncbi:MAG: malto-oligosyltrehalose synthase [Chloroflexi bacterium]|nr:malto-oligosyltrehalose synthase [Chloroflexota bacterium]